MSDNTELQVIQNTDIAVINDIDQLLAQAARQDAISEKSSGIPYISIKGSKFKLGENLIGRQMEVVVLATAYDNAYYDRPYDPDRETILPPACFAINQVQEDMQPHADSPVPVHTDCKHCEYNKFKSAANGKGKMCKNGRRLLLASIDSESGEVNLDDLAIVRIPATSLKEWATYVKKVDAMHKRPVWSIVTHLSFDEEADWPIVLPKVSRLIENKELLSTIHGNLNLYNDNVLQPYSTSEYVPLDLDVETTNAEQKTAKRSKMS